jgi:hypothetical protein
VPLEQLHPPSRHPLGTPRTIQGCRSAGRISLQHLPRPLEGYIVVDGVCIGLLESLYTGQEGLRDKAFITELLPTFMVILLGGIKPRRARTHVCGTDDRDDEIFTFLVSPFTEEFEGSGDSESILECLRPISRRREYQTLDGMLSNWLPKQRQTPWGTCLIILAFQRSLRA